MLKQYERQVSRLFYVKFLWSIQSRAQSTEKNRHKRERLLLLNMFYTVDTQLLIDSFDKYHIVDGFQHCQLEHTLMLF